MWEGWGRGGVGELRPEAGEEKYHGLPKRLRGTEAGAGLIRPGGEWGFFDFRWKGVRRGRREGQPERCYKPGFVTEERLLERGGG